MRITVLGCGWYGTPLSHALKAQGHEVLGTTRDPKKKAELESKGIKAQLLSSPEIPSRESLDSEILILNIPPSAGGMSWLSQWNIPTSTWVIFISSTSGKQAQEEEWIRKNTSRWTILRLGGLIGPDRHPGRSLSGKKNIIGRLWPVNLLHQEDAVGFTLKIIEKEVIQELIEVVSDEHHTREEFYQEYCRRMNLPLPEFDPADNSQKPEINNQRAKEIYEFKWSTMIGRRL